ncbi:hypothetical protein MKZ26_16860 [Sporosarcina sp. FSL K6-6792]
MVRVRKRIGNNYSELAFESTLNKDNILKKDKEKMSVGHLANELNYK